MSATAQAIWHDVECGGYDADLPLWEELATCRGGTVLELGCGTGRIALHLARRGHRVLGLDREAALLASLEERAADLPVEAILGDAVAFEIEGVALALAPMQFLQLLEGAEERIACLRCVAACLEPEGLFAAAIVERVPRATGALPPLPDVREVDGWIYSSLPVVAMPLAQEIVLRRLRQTVSPAGDLREEEDEIRLQTFTIDQLLREAEQAGLELVGRRTVPATDAHVGSEVVLLGRAG